MTLPLSPLLAPHYAGLAALDQRARDIFRSVV